MKTKFGFPGVLFALFIVAAFVLAPAAEPGRDAPQRQRRPSHGCGTRTRPASCDVPDQDRLQTRARDRDQDRLHLLTSAPPLEENGGDMVRHRIQERFQHNWYLYPNLAFVLIWPGF